MPKAVPVPAITAHTELVYTQVETPFGSMLLVASSVGVCALQFGQEAALEAGVRCRYPGAVAVRATAIASYIDPLRAYFGGGSSTVEAPLDVYPTPFQKRVWRALQDIPYGCTRTYKEIAAAIGAPTAARAVARACATNPVAVVIPCHRVVRTDGGYGGYRWGMEVKAALLALERAHQAHSA